MTIVQLEYLVAVDTYRSFNKAATHCFVTQPTLSLQLQKLEDVLGVKLFERNPVVPTKIGTEIIEKARLLLDDYYRIREVAQQEQRALAGELHIGVITTLAPYLIPGLMSRFRSKHPGVKLVIWEETTAQIIHKVKQGVIDCGIVSTPLNESQLLGHTLFTEKLVAYVDTTSPLAQKKTLKPEDIDPAEIWVLNEGHCLRDEVLKMCQKKREYPEEPSYEFHTGSLETLRRLVDENGGATMLPELALTQLSKEQQRKIRPFKAPEPTRSIGIITPKTFVKRRMIESLKQEIVEVYKTAIQAKL